MDPVAILAKPGVAVAARNAPTAQRGATKIRQDWSPASRVMLGDSPTLTVRSRVTSARQVSTRIRWRRQNVRARRATLADSGLQRRRRLMFAKTARQVSIKIRRRRRSVKIRRASQADSGMWPQHRLLVAQIARQVSIRINRGKRSARAASVFRGNTLRMWHRRRPWSAKAQRASRASISRVQGRPHRSHARIVLRASSRI